MKPSGALLDRLVDWQLRSPRVVLGVVLAVTMVFAVLASRLTLRTRYDALLPDDSPSVRELRRLERRAPAGQTVLVVLEGSAGADSPALRRLGDSIVRELAALGPSVVTSVEDGPHELRDFLGPRLGLFLESGELARLDHDLESRWDYEVARETGALLDDDAPPPIAWKDIEARLRSQAGTSERGEAVDRFPDGYYESRDGRALVVMARSPIAGGDLGRAGRVMASIESAVERARAADARYAKVGVSYAGELPTGLREYGVISRDLTSVGATGIALVLLAVVFYFLRLRAVLVMGAAIACGLLWTFGLTELVIGHLNVATAFLVSIVAGNGINVGILYQARYFEERQRGFGAAAAARTALRETWRPTAIAALGGVAAYGSLLVTDFRAFRDFGFIAASGMVLCWVVKTLMVPPLLVLLEGDRAAPRPRWLARSEMAYGRPFAWLVARGPAAFAAMGTAVALLGIVATVRYVARDPMEYDLRKTETDRSETADLHHAWDVARQVLGSSQGAVVIAADSAEDAESLEGILTERWRASPAGRKPFVAVHGLADLIAPGQAGKLPVLASIRDRLVRARERGFLDDAGWERVRQEVPPAELRAYGESDLPASVVDRFTDGNGVRGSLIYLESDPGTADDLRSLVRFADAFRETKLPSGRTVRGSGNPVILADMLRAVSRDVPRAVVVSFVLTVLMVVVSLRRGRGLFPVLVALAVGCGGVACFLYVADVKLNFLNFAALPITFGIGVDYAVNVAQRYEADRRRGILGVLRASGGAVVLCSLTTMLGYLALLGSHNAAIRGLGAIAAVGEVSCLLAAVVVLPAMYLLREGQGRSEPAADAVRGLTPKPS